MGWIAFSFLLLHSQNLQSEVVGSTNVKEADPSISFYCDKNLHIGQELSILCRS
jgi:hypothetical protein